MALVPTLCAVGCTLATWAGLALYADKLAKISSGSLLKKAQQQQRNKEAQKAAEAMNVTKSADTTKLLGVEPDADD